MQTKRKSSEIGQLSEKPRCPQHVCSQKERSPPQTGVKMWKTLQKQQRILRMDAQNSWGQTPGHLASLNSLYRLRPEWHGMPKREGFAVFLTM